MATAFKQLADNAITTSTTTMTSTGVTSITAVSNVFPTPGNGFIMTLWNGADPTLDANMEKVTVTANASGVLTTSATTKTHTSPTNIAILDVSSNLTDMQTAINAIETSLPASIAGLGVVQTFTAKQTFTAAVNYTPNTVTVASGAATVPVTARITTVTNNAASAVAITITTSGAVDGQLLMVRFLDFSAAAQALTWVNTENSVSTVPATSNGSTTLPVTVGFQFNSATTKWRCIGWV